MSKVKITFRGWPWQKSDHWSSDGSKFGWNPFKVVGFGRFGGGWAFKLGITISERLDDFVIDLGIGSIRIKYDRHK